MSKKEGGVLLRDLRAAFDARLTRLLLAGTRTGRRDNENAAQFGLADGDV